MRDSFSRPQGHVERMRLWKLEHFVLYLEARMFLFDSNRLPGTLERSCSGVLDAIPRLGFP
jgi:hypothetical protein